MTRSNLIGRSRHLAFHFLFLLALTGATATKSSFGAAAPGGPGIRLNWAAALKEAVGTAYEKVGSQSPVWFTVAEGALSEIYYPSVDQPQIAQIHFIVSDGQGFISNQLIDTKYKIQFGNSGAKQSGFAVHIEGEDKSGAYQYTQDIVTDPSSPVLRFSIQFKWNRPGLQAYINVIPAVQNQGGYNIGYTQKDGLYATSAITRANDPARNTTRKSFESAAIALIANVPFTRTTAGFAGVSDGLTDLQNNGRLTTLFDRAGPGNVELTAELPSSTGSALPQAFEFAVGFGPNFNLAYSFAKNSMQKPHSQVRLNYAKSWRDYSSSLNVGGLQFLDKNPAALTSAVLIKMHEDKLNRGSIIASLSKPGVPNSYADDKNTGGYHLVWPRDLYHAGMGLLAAGDAATALDVLDAYLRLQKADGSWNQNAWLDGSPYWSAIQMDQMAFPIIYAWHLHKKIGLPIEGPVATMIKKAANFLVKHGPTSQQDRWEELGGYLPNTLAIETVALEIASELLNDGTYLGVSKEWNSKIESWTVVNQSPLGRGYFLRGSPSGTPNSPEVIQIANGGGNAYAHEIIDGGFLDLVRYKLRSPSDSNILATLALYDNPQLGVAKLNRNTGAMAYRRYNRDGYGPKGVGGFWPLLAGERGHYALAAGDKGLALKQLKLLESLALSSGPIPEQSTGADTEYGLGVASPLVWAHSELILLYRSLEEGSVFDSP